MSFPLPLVGSAAREMLGDLSTAVETLDPANAVKLLSTLQAKKAAERMFEADTTKAMNRICFIIIRSENDERWLISIGRRGGWKKEWNFGTGR